MTYYARVGAVHCIAVMAPSIVGVVPSMVGAIPIMVCLPGKLNGGPSIVGTIPRMVGAGATRVVAASEQDSCCAPALGAL